MKTRITLGTVMLLSLGSALAGGMIYQKEKASSASEARPTAESVQVTELTPELIAKWKVTAATAEYSPAMLPI